MTIRADIVQAELSLIERGDSHWPLPLGTPSCAEAYRRSLYEREGGVRALSRRLGGFRQPACVLADVRFIDGVDERETGRRAA